MYTAIQAVSVAIVFKGVHGYIHTCMIFNKTYCEMKASLLKGCGTHTYAHIMPQQSLAITEEF